MPINIDGKSTMAINSFGSVNLLSINSYGNVQVIHIKFILDQKICRVFVNSWRSKQGGIDEK